MDVNPISVRTWSILGQRGTFGQALTSLAQKSARIVALTADLCNTSGLTRFQAACPERLVNTGIAEQNMVGVAAGMADAGYIPFATTFANFASLRACEMMRHFMGYMRCNIKMVGLGAGFSMGLFGNTHYGLEDIAAIRAIPNIVILSPADGLEVVKCVEAAAETENPVYLRLTGTMNNPVVYRKDFDFHVGRAVALKQGSDVSIIATGSMVFYALEAARILEEEGISCSVLDMHTIKPLDEAAVSACCESRLVVTAEEHSVTGGLGSAVAEVLAEKAGHPPLLGLGVPQGYPRAGEYGYMLAQQGLTARDIAKKVKMRYMEAVK